MDLRQPHGGGRSIGFDQKTTSAHQSAMRIRINLPFTLGLSAHRAA